MNLIDKLITKSLKILFLGKILETKEEAFSKLKPKQEYILNYIGENSKTAEDELLAFFQYFSLIPKYSISIKPSQFQNNPWLIEHLASKTDNIWIDAEDYSEGDKQLGLVLGLKKISTNVGLTIQLKSPDWLSDLHVCLTENIRIRLCKGAYKQKDKNKGEHQLYSDAVGAVNLCEERGKSELLEIATMRDSNFVLLAAKHKLTLQILYGWHKKFQDYPYNTRIYIPFGTRWLPYIKRRLCGR